MMQRFAAIILSLFFFFHSFFSLAQSNNQYIFRHINQTDGLLHNRITCIVQDARGFIWILNPNGLQRYDGLGFINYPYDLNNPVGISYASACGLFADKDHDRLWITQNSIVKLDLKTNTFTYYPKEQLIKDSSFGFDVYRDSTGETWLAGNFGVARYNPTNQQIHSSYFTASWLMPDHSNTWYSDLSNEERWLSLWSYGLMLFDKKTKKVFSHNYNPIHHPLLEKMNVKLLYYTFIDSRGNTWMSSNTPEFYRYNPISQKIVTYSLYNIIQLHGKTQNNENTAFVNCFFEDNHHHIWLGTQNAGLLLYNEITDQFQSITTGNENKDNIQYNFEINCFFQDQEENIWLGTDKGITIFNPYRQYFHTVRHEENNTASLPKNEIQQIIETGNGDILAGTWGGGMTVYDNQWHFKRNIRFTNKPAEYNLLWSFIQNDDGTIWAGCQHGFIHIYDPVKETIRTIQPPELNQFTIHCMTKDKNGNIFFGLHNGKIAKWDKVQNKFYSYDNDRPGIQQSFAPVQGIFIDTHQRCWAGTEMGLKEFDMDKMTYSAFYTADKNNPSSISANTIQSIDGYNDSTLIIGTVYGGLDLFNTNAKTFSHLTSDNGLPSTTVNNVKKDGENNIWFTTDFGLYKYVIGKKQVVRYNIEPGIINSSFKSGNFYALKDGRWLTSTSTEIISFDPGILQRQDAGNRPVEITGFKIFDKDIFIDSFLYFNKPVKLSYRQNFLSIEFGTLSFSGLQETKYYYQLSGINNDWVYAGSKRFANYTNLEPGEYTFKVKTNNEGINPVITSFTILIAPPFWKTNWFRIICLLLIAGIIYTIVRWRINTFRKEEKRKMTFKNQMAEMEMKALRSQMNPHFIFNSLNAIDNLIQTNQKEKATTYLVRFAKLIRSVLDSSKNSVVPFQKDYESLQLYLQMEQFRCNDKFEYELVADDDLLQSDYKVPPLIIQPFVENAIHHGLLNKQTGNRKLSVSAMLENDCIKYTVCDNGVGRTKANQIKEINKPDHQSYGIDITTERIQLYNQNGKNNNVTFTDLLENNEPSGTKVEIRLKIYDTH